MSSVRPRTLAIGDIHGCRRALGLLLKQVDPQPGDTLITLGDYVDRGPDSSGVLDDLIGLSSQMRVIALRGNHDQMMRRAREHEMFFAQWLLVGGTRTIVSYQEKSLAGVPDAHWRFLDEACVDWYETDTHIYVHGHLDRQKPMAEQDPEVLCWKRLDGAEAHFSGKTIICGHTAQATGQPAHLGHTICIDTAACHGLWLTCMDVETGHLWQADEAGASRELQLAEPVSTTG